MCGIVGYIGTKTAAPLLLEGLRRLEYRGYDSAGLCTLNNGGLEVRKCVGRVARLGDLLVQKPAAGTLGISHTRWATHGLPSDANAHPHLDRSGKLALVHNGIIENYAALRHKLSRHEHKFLSQTDTEVLAHLVGHHLDHLLAKRKPLSPELVAAAILAATREATGTYAIALVHAELPGHLFGARRGSPLVVGVGEDETFLASDVSPIVAHTRKVIYLHDGDIVMVNANAISVASDGKPAWRAQTTVHWSPEAAERGEFPHYMLKEIFEQPERVSDALRLALRAGTGSAVFEESALSRKALAKVRRLVLVACGTSWHAALVGEYLIETLAGLPVEVECASEMRYRHRPLEKDALVVSISQSGETADTLAAIRGARAQRLRTLAIVNVAGSTIARESDADLQMRAGPEIGVASTKAFEMQVLWLTLLGLALGRQRGHLSPTEGRKLTRELLAIPSKLETILAQNSHIRVIAKKYAGFEDFLFMGRQFNFPIALEGALKLKEISYIHAEGYPSAEMKHGPIALVSEAFPSVFVVPRDAMYEKNMSNIEEIKARRGPIIAVATAGDEEIGSKADDVIYIPPTLDCLQSLLTVVPLQLLAYHIAVERGCDVDKPRNLAKSVTVE
ncbi:MAG TPA: glutamine--fructose-6-phosphate transaminase (isomerizing) [Candidatus Binatia bacterium]|jgi:glucosamine--fructose-6-phosphate aminotransferase (isomerizing)|nr:glutamine--fructose-6-phosphate transaminase (isomerizing) [Candidatus Binatia bacterium]